MTHHLRLPAASALLVAGLVTGQLVYSWAIVPRLSEWRAIPRSWYVPLMLPPVLGFLVAGVMLRDAREVLIAITAAVFLGFVPFALTNSPSVESWPAAVLFWYLVSALCLGVSFTPAQLIWRRRLAAEPRVATDVVLE
jgi:hypothetical protein